jgi:hypothetical protein
VQPEVMTGAMTAPTVLNAQAIRVNPRPILKLSGGSIQIQAPMTIFWSE